jgi:excisionase family DNA binding protein
MPKPAVTVPVYRVVGELHPKLMRLEDAARYLSIGTKALRKLIQAGELPAGRVEAHGHGCNAPLLVSVADLDRLADRIIRSSQ